jgi:hypothetical protein
MTFIQENQITRLNKDPTEFELRVEQHKLTVIQPGQTPGQNSTKIHTTKISIQRKERDRTSPRPHTHKDNLEIQTNHIRHKRPICQHAD